MIRKTIIAVLTLAVVAVAAAWPLSYLTRMCAEEADVNDYTGWPLDNGWYQSLGREPPQAHRREHPVRGLHWHRHLSKSHWIRVDVADGRFDLVVVTSKDPKILAINVSILRGELNMYPHLGTRGARSSFTSRPPQRLVRVQQQSSTRSGYVVASCPVWVVLMVYAAYPVLVFIRGPLRRRRRRKHGLCVRCGYNLTGLAEPRCPECGEAV